MISGDKFTQKLNATQVLFRVLNLKARDSVILNLSKKDKIGNEENVFQVR